jgi:hypothetical protein
MVTRVHGGRHAVLSRRLTTFVNLDQQDAGSE